MTVSIGDNVRLTGPSWTFPSQGLGRGQVLPILEILDDGRVLVDDRPGYAWYADITNPADPWAAELITSPTILKES